MSYRCPLARCVPKSMDTERIKRDGWLQYKILVVDLADQRLSWEDRELLKTIGTKLYGGKQ